AKQPGLSPEVQSAVASTLEEAKRLGEMAENLLTISRMESVWGKREHARVDLRALAAETMEQLAALAEEKNIRFGHSQGAAIFVLGDRDRLKQVLVNLLDNAIKYTNANGAVTVETSVQGARVRLTVRDTGVGIAADQLEDIFS